MQNWKKRYVFGHIDKFWNGNDAQIKKNTCKNANLGSIFIPEKYVFRVCFESSFTRMISSLKYKCPPPPRGNLTWVMTKNMNFLVIPKSPKGFFVCFCCYLSIYLLASCISALAAWPTKNLHKARSSVATSASSTDQSNPRVLRPLWITSFHMVLGLPRFRFPWVGFQRYNVLGILPGSIRNTWPNHLSRRFLIMFVSWGCLVRDLT